MQRSITEEALKPGLATARTLRRVAALLFGLTYFGWVIVWVAAYQWLVGRLTGLDRTAWHHIEGEPVLFGCAFGLAAILVVPLVVAMLAGSRRLPMAAALVVTIVHVPLVLWSDPTGFDGNEGVLLIIVGLDVAVIAVVAAWLRRIRSGAPGLAF